MQTTEQNSIKIIEKLPGKVWDIRYSTEMEAQPRKKRGVLSKLISFIFS